MAIYSMVKNNTFNGIPLPAIAVMKDKEVRVIKEFGYEDLSGGFRENNRYYTYRRWLLYAGRI